MHPTALVERERARAHRRQQNFAGLHFGHRRLEWTTDEASEHVKGESRGLQRKCMAGNGLSASDRYIAREEVHRATSPRGPQDPCQQHAATPKLPESARSFYARSFDLSTEASTPPLPPSPQSGRLARVRTAPMTDCKKGAIRFARRRAVQPPAPARHAARMFRISASRVVSGAARSAVRCC